jgi:hypothetical protein
MTYEEFLRRSAVSILRCAGSRPPACASIEAEAPRCRCMCVVGDFVDLHIHRSRSSARQRRKPNVVNLRLKAFEQQRRASPCGEMTPPVHQAESLRAIAAYALSGLGGRSQYVSQGVALCYCLKGVALHVGYAGGDILVPANDGHGELIRRIPVRGYISIERQHVGRKGARRQASLLVHPGRLTNKGACPLVDGGTAAPFCGPSVDLNPANRTSAGVTKAPFRGWGVDPCRRRETVAQTTVCLCKRQHFRHVGYTVCNTHRQTNKLDWI